MMRLKTGLKTTDIELSYELISQKQDSLISSRNNRAQKIGHFNICTEPQTLEYKG